MQRIVVDGIRSENVRVVSGVFAVHQGFAINSREYSCGLCYFVNLLYFVNQGIRAY